jgi:hypothetical protein
LGVTKSWYRVDLQEGQINDLKLQLKKVSEMRESASVRQEYLDSVMASE